jgi:hypothetical protein
VDTDATPTPDFRDATNLAAPDGALLDTTACPAADTRVGYVARLIRPSRGGRLPTGIALGVGRTALVQSAIRRKYRIGVAEW